MVGLNPDAPRRRERAVTGIERRSSQHRLALSRRRGHTSGAGAVEAEPGRDDADVARGAFPSALATLVPTAIGRLRASTDALEVAVVQGTTDELVASVRDGRLHVALCFQDVSLPRREHAETRRVDLVEEPMVAAIGPSHRLAGRARLRLHELAADTWTAATRDGLIHRACVAAGFEPRIAYLTDDPLAIRTIVAEGLAVTLTPHLLADHLHGISTPRLVGTPIRRAIYTVAPTTGAHPLVAPFLDALPASA